MDTSRETGPPDWTRDNYNEKKTSKIDSKFFWVMVF